MLPTPSVDQGTIEFDQSLPSHLIVLLHALHQTDGSWQAIAFGSIVGRHREINSSVKGQNLNSVIAVVSRLHYAFRFTTAEFSEFLENFAVKPSSIWRQ